MPLTDASVRALRAAPTRFDVPDGRVPGLYLSVLPSGLKQWTLRYRTQGKQRRLVLGEFGDFPKVSLAKARDLAERQRPKIREGGDPVADRRAAKATRTDTVAALATDYLKRHARPNKRTAAEDERMLDAEVLPRLGDRSLGTLTRRDIRDLLNRIVDRGSPVMANRVLALVRKMLNFGVDHDWLQANPVARISKPTRETSRDRVLSDEEIRALWRLLERQPETGDRAAPGRPSQRSRDEDPLCPISATMAAVTKARLLTAQRGGEVARMCWTDVDLLARVWTIPAADAKNGEAHRVPLTADAISLIEAQEPDELHRVGYVFQGRFGNAVSARSKKSSATLAKVLGFDFRGHDLRRTAATGMAAVGVPRDHIARVLNHVEGGARATRVYDRYNYDAEKRAALEAWQGELRRMIAGVPKAPVIVPIARHG